ncbi:Hypothetical protein IALB_2194 [Ignavibacterium album JCM 16511]|uniref:Uncharacterized protein n=1 Tax=Ignavibacterium album (strain DSM 19864 / JCM 16511 / NBRC 101810 / Mat9-16) TaxID=945713 RepID=I0ALP2_IGNAJ|nr:Hypothetical protein IALB_2194 [Ignavibacterium album JCM 16511]
MLFQSSFDIVCVSNIPGLIRKRLNYISIKIFHDLPDLSGRSNRAEPRPEEIKNLERTQNILFV